MELDPFKKVGAAVGYVLFSSLTMHSAVNNGDMVYFVDEKTGISAVAIESVPLRTAGGLTMDWHEYGMIVGSSAMPVATEALFYILDGDNGSGSV